MRSNVCGQTVTTKCSGSGIAPNGVCQVSANAGFGDGDASKAIWADYRAYRTRATMTIDDDVSDSHWRIPCDRRQLAVLKA